MTRPALQQRPQHHANTGEDCDHSKHRHEDGALDGGSKLGSSQVGDAGVVAHSGISSIRSVGGSKAVGQLAASSANLATPSARSRRQVALRLLRIREASGLSQAVVGKRVGVSKRAMGGLERAEHRMTALEAFLFLFDLVVEQQGLDAALSAILTEEQRHAAFSGNARGPSDRASHQDQAQPEEQPAPIKRAA